MATEPALLLKIQGISMSRRGGREPANIRMAVAHNLRADQNERGARAHIDPTRTHLNRVLRGPGTPALVVALAGTKMAEAGIDASKLRKDHVQAIELIASLPPASGVNEAEFFAAVLDWVEGRYGTNNVLSFVLHHDEGAPHCHALVLPLVNGRMVGASLKSPEAIGEAVKDFFAVVAKGFGMKRSKASPSNRAELARAVLDRMNATSDPAMKSQSWAQMRALIEANPYEMAESLGITVAERKKPARSFTAIMTSPGRKTSEDRERKAIRFEDGNVGAKAIRFDPEKDPKRILCTFPFTTTPQSAPDSRPGHAATTAEPAPAADHQHPGTDTQPEAIGTIGELWERVGVKLPPWQVQRVPAAPQSKTNQPRAIESLAELWEVVGRRVVRNPDPHQDRQPPADRLELGPAAQQRAIERHARPKPPAPVLADFAGAACRLDERDDGTVVDRTEFAHEFWND